jgi:hypothetical protein
VQELLYQIRKFDWGKLNFSALFQETLDRLSNIALSGQLLTGFYKLPYCFSQRHLDRLQHFHNLVNHGRLFGCEGTNVDRPRGKFFN